MVEPECAKSKIEVAGSDLAEDCSSSPRPRLARSKTEGNEFKHAMPNKKATRPGHENCLSNDMNPKWLASKAEAIKPEHPRLRAGSGKPKKVKSKTRRKKPKRLELCRGRADPKVRASTTDRAKMKSKRHNPDVDDKKSK